jgi:hypothetical protein
VPLLCEFNPGVCLTTEEKARKTLSQGSRRVLVYILHITKTPTQLQYPHIHTPTLLQNTHTHTHTLQNARARTRAQTHTHTHTHIHTHTHTYTPTHYITIQSTTVQMKTNPTQDIPNCYRQNIIKYPQYKVTLTNTAPLSTRTLP